ncbi:MAG: hypothetical protein AAFY38_07255 [Pseudomonadota bacterium]
MRRIFRLLLVLTTLAACGGAADLDAPPVPLGDFNLVHNIVVASKAQKGGPISRAATEEQLTEAVQSAIAARFDRYDGARDYHFGVSVEGYILAQPGIPLVLAPKSGLIIRVTVWDDAAGKKLNDPPEEIMVLETFGTGAIIGSGYTLTAEEQLEQLAQNAAKAIERFLVQQMDEDGWFKGARAESQSG